MSKERKIYSNVPQEQSEKFNGTCSILIEEIIFFLSRRNVIIVQPTAL